MVRVFGYSVFDSLVNLLISKKGILTIILFIVGYILKRLFFPRRENNAS